jgi:hypothetical protein
MISVLSKTISFLAAFKFSILIIMARNSGNALQIRGAQAPSGVGQLKKIKDLLYLVRCRYDPILLSRYDLDL